MINYMQVMTAEYIQLLSGGFNDISYNTFGNRKCGNSRMSTVGML